jgi:hypothetical protein
MEYGIGDGGQEETQTHEGSNEEVDLDEEQHRYFRHQHQQNYNKPVINSNHFQNFWLISHVACYHPKQVRGDAG